jgi:hypothetical protein
LATVTDEDQIVCSAMGVGVKIVNDEARLFVTLGVENGEATHIILLPQERWGEVITSMMAAAHEAHKINDELSGYVGEERLIHLSEIASRYNAGSN